MADRTENRAEEPADPGNLAAEARHARPAAAAAVTAGLLMLAAGAIQQFSFFAHYPTVGLLQGLTPALHGQPNPPVSPRAGTLEYYDHHAATELLSSALFALGALSLAYALTHLYRATRARRPQMPGAAGVLAIAGPVAVALFGLIAQSGLLTQILLSVSAQDFVHSADHGHAAVNHALGSGALGIARVLAFPALITLGFAFVMIALNAMRVGLLTRFMGILGIIVGVLFVIPLGSPLPIVQAFWLIALGVLFAGRWPNGTPPAWSTGRAEPWPSQQELREARESSRDATEGPPDPTAAGSAVLDPAAPAPAVPHPSSKKRRRKRR